MFVILGDKRSAAVLESAVIGFFITNRIEGEHTHIISDGQEALGYVSDADNCNAIFFVDLDTGDAPQSGLRLAKTVRKHNKYSHIIFLAASGKHALASLEGVVRPSGYLQKPMSNRAITALLRSIYNDNLVDTIKVQAGSYYYYIRISKIVYMEKQGKKVVLHSVSDSVEAYDTLGQMQKKCGETMIYANKSQLVNRAHIDYLESGNNRLVLQGGFEVYVSRNMRKHFQ